MFVDVDQNTDEWFELRLKKATSSGVAKIMAHEGKAFGDPAVKYAEKIALEIVTGVKDETENYKNGYMERGHELEPLAIQAYEMDNFCETTNGGFFISECGRMGDSPDRNVGDKGSLEVKSVIPSTQWKRIKKGGFDTAYKWQIHNHIWMGDKEWCDFASYCPEMPEKWQLYVYRVYRDDDIIEKMNQRIGIDFMKEVDKNVKILKS